MALPREQLLLEVTVNHCTMANLSSNFIFSYCRMPALNFNFSALITTQNFSVDIPKTFVVYNLFHNVCVYVFVASVDSSIINHILDDKEVS